jgi:CRISPR type III-B/RAMP module RAMP protein Cmr6
VSATPLPQRIAELLEPGSPGNPALFFDRGMSRDDGTKGWKEKSLQTFAATFNRRDPSEYKSFLTRRAAILEHLAAHTLDRTTQTRLVIGLGLPSPIETGFLFDRLTGCPYLPGSSVKGLLRATARLVQDGEIEGGKDFWTAANLEKIFGPEIERGKIARKGKAVFYDAFPIAWPMLEVDVLTPHYKAYYGDKKEKEAPADWDNPNPVAFLTVKAGTAFRFAVQASERDAEELEKLLDLGLDWLGIGAKKSAGYGIFGKEAPAAPQPPSAAPPQLRRPEPAPPPPPPPRKSGLLWENAELSLRQGSVIARRGKQTATGRREDVEPEILESLIHKRTLRADVEVLKISGSEFRLVRVNRLRNPGQ